MNYAVHEVLQFVEENDVKFIRLTFCDIFGMQKNIAIMPSQLARAFEQGISFDASAVRGFMNVAESDLFLVPDPGTLAVLPWRPAQGRVVRFFCNILYPDGTPFEGDGRRILKDAAERAQKQGYSCKFGPECEFYLFETNEQGYPTYTPQDNASYCDIAPADRGENVRREICLTLEEMGILPETSHHEQGPGQNEVDFKYADPLEAADNVMAFRSVVKAIASKNGLYASFCPKPLTDKSGNGMHINMSLQKGERNLFENFDEHIGGEAASFVQGVLNRAGEITAFLNPLTNSYRRLGEFEAPRYISWSRQNRSQLVRVPAAKGAYSRFELRSPDPACNPYLAFALLIGAGLEGISQNAALCAPANLDLFHANKAQLETFETLPQSLEEALEKAAASHFAKQVLTQSTVEKYINQKQRECGAHRKAGGTHAFEMEQYFNDI
ncbi:MAG: glutamine synthetase family protein [Oscillospiraceae bacterium]|nr:glutamine synthetase family protein [Oscillospiraceae bacterium]